MLINDASITGSLIVNASASLQNISLGGNIIPDETNLRNLGSTEKFFKEIYVSTGSINFVDGGNIVAVLSAGTITAIQSNTSSANSRLNAIEIITSSTTARLSALETSSASVDTLNTNQNSRLGSLETISASNISRITALETTSASVDTLNITQNSRLSALETTSASVDTLNTNQNSRLSSLEIKTGSLATTGSNTFIGTQTITGSLFISANLVVQGTSSLQNITASAVSIGTNIVNLNTANPAIRYAGLVIGDSGSVGGSGSFLYDSVQDEMIFVHRGASTVVTSSVTLMGPETYDNVGSETYLTSNRITKGTGNEHLSDSCIFDNGTTVCVNANLVGSGTGMFSSTVSATQYTATSTGGSGLRIYGAAGANQWDMYLNSTNLRFSDNTGTGNIVFDRPLNGTSAVFSGGVTSVGLLLNTGGYLGSRSLRAASDLLILYGGTAGFNFTDHTNSTVLASIANSGAATFNTSATTAVSVISTGTASGLQLQNTAGTPANWIIQSDGGVAAGQAALRFYSLTASAYRMSIDGSGNVGIGITTPAVKLDVLGTVRAGVNSTFFADHTYLGINYNFGVGEATDSVDYKINGGAFTTGGNFRWFTQTGGATPIERMRITSSGASLISGCSTFYCTAQFSTIQKSTNGHWYKIPFMIQKNSATGSAKTVCIVDINNLSQFHEFIVHIDYGARLQGVSDSVTNISSRMYGINRFNDGAVAINESYIPVGGSGNINTHASVSAAVAASNRLVVKVDFSTSPAFSSFVWGEIRVFSMENLNGNLSIPNNEWF